MKRLLKVTLSLLCVLSMTGCGSKESKADTNKNKEATTQKMKKKKEIANILKILIENISYPIQCIAFLFKRTHL